MSLENLVLNFFEAGAGFVIGLMSGYRAGPGFEAKEFAKRAMLECENINANCLLDKCEEIENEAKKMPLEASGYSAMVSLLHYMTTKNIDHGILSAYVAAFAGFYLGRKAGEYLGKTCARKQFKKVEQEVDEALKTVEQDIVKGRIKSSRYFVNVYRFLCRKASKLKHSKIYEQYFLAKVRQINEKAEIYRYVKDFVENEIHDNRLKTNIV
ncbi:hypothetical protein KY312_03925, partial [Candidatus Woesearchaeota archaeon]|nr:hypothetical protein [Candidatus Woesearchaeota archaeon]